MPRLPLTLRPFVSWLMFLVVTVQAVSALVIYLPHDKAAWRFLSLPIQSWFHIHMVFGLLLIAVACVHITLNFRALLNYLKQKMAQPAPKCFCARVKPEPLLAFLIVAIFAWSAVKELPPASWLSDLRQFLEVIIKQG